MRTRSHAARWAAAPLVALAACGGADEPGSAASSTTATTAAQDTTTTTTVVPFGPLENLPVVQIEATDLPDPPAGYIDEDIEALAGQAVTIATRGLEEAVWAATPKEAFDHVLSGLPLETTGDLGVALIEQFGEVESWALADSFHPQDLPVGPPRVFARDWSVELEDAGGGETFLALELRLSVAYAFEPEAEPRVALVQRAVRLGSFAPRDPTAWPSVGFTTHVDAIDRCALFGDGVLRPSSNLADDIEHFIETIDPASERWATDPDGSEGTAAPAEGEC
ncbi:hypothetical protein BH18ACT4_BH18ACT4_16190 [soil metagenome]